MARNAPQVVVYSAFAASGGCVTVSLYLDLTQIHTPREHVERTFAAEAFGTADDEFRIAGRVELVMDVERQDRRVRLTGALRVPLEVPCSRCLEPILLPVDTPFDLWYLPASVNTGEGEREVETEDLGVAFYESDAIDLGQLVREQCYLVLPMKPLCSPDCRGLCLECGGNLNQQTCQCERRWVDPRMAALAQLLPKEPKGN